jgi:prolyl oligopeptidase PreP (S9A serine peptidase family)
MSKNWFFYHLALITAALLLFGCANLSTTSTSGNNTQSFSAYAENVFRRQNNVTSRVMTLSPEDFSNEAQYDALLDAEKNMHNACELLNNYAQRIQDGENVSVLYRSRVGIGIKECDRATLKLETLLQNVHLISSAAIKDNVK